MNQRFKNFIMRAIITITIVLFPFLYMVFFLFPGYEHFLFAEILIDCSEV